MKTEKDLKEKVQILADRLQSLLPLVDIFVNNISDEDFELLETAKDGLKDKINYGNSASVLIMALGGNYDDTEDRMKVKTLDCLIELIKTRKEYREELLEKQEKQKNKQECYTKDDLIRLLEKDHIKPIRYIFNMSDRIIVDRDIRLNIEEEF